MYSFKIKVGTNQLGYNQIRNFTGLPFENVRFQKVYDLNKIFTYAKYKILNKVDYKMINRFNDFGLSDVHLYHFFNTLTPVKKPWIVTYETTLPRLDPDFKRGYEWMSSRYCKKIIAYSLRAYNGQMRLLDNHPSYKDEISRKMTILPPTQKKLIDNLNEKSFDDTVVFTFIGGAFYRKGGWELLQAFEKLKELNSPVRLNIISKLALDGYKDEHITLQMRNQTKEILSNNSLIEYYPSLSNQQVLEILKRSHVGILPSWGETYGYSILEAMACGCAVIVPDVSPFPEFVSNEWGWLLKVGTTFKNGIESSDPTKQNSINMIDEIVSVASEIVENRELLYYKCNNALSRISMAHDPYIAASFLEKLYREVI